MITTNIINRCFPVRGDERGTAFILDYNGQQYLITANHVLGKSRELQLRYDSSWIQLPNQRVVAIDERLDIAVLSFSEKVDTFPVELGTGGVVLGESAYFLGFPALDELKGLFKLPDSKREQPLPKGGIIAGLGKTFGYVDMQTNEGYSGSPVFVIRDREIRVVGVCTHALREDNKDNEKMFGLGLEDAGFTRFVTINEVTGMLDEIDGNHE